MIRYIDADALRGAMMIVSLESGDTTADKYIQMVEDMPAEDVAPVVRCRNCKYCAGSHDVGLVCTKDVYKPSAEFFCAEGEKKDV